MKPWYKSKTIWLAVAQAALGVFVAFEYEYELEGGILLLKSALDMVIRYLSVEPLS